MMLMSKDDDNRLAEATPAISAQEFCEKFLARQTVESSEFLRGLCGRFIRGTKEDDFLKLSDEPGKRLSWICSHELLFDTLGKTPAQAMVHSVGHSVDWVRNRLDDGTSHKLVVFPGRGRQVQVTWDNLFQLCKDVYGDQVFEKLAPHFQALKSTPYHTIDPSKRLKYLSELPVAEKYQHPEYITVEHFQTLEAPTLYECRGFLYHSVGCNLHFTGTGTNREGIPEFMVPNTFLKDIPDHVVINLEVSLDDINALQQQE